MIRIILIFFFIVSINFFSPVMAKTYKIGTVFEKEIVFSKNFILPLTSGKWEVVDRYTESYVFLYFKGNAIARLENNELMELIWIEKANLSGTNMGIIDSAVNSIIFKDRYDGCYERPEYLIVEVYKRGGTHNCLVINHLETNKELFAPEDPLASSSKLKKWLRDNSIKIPPITFDSFHTYFSRLSRGEWYVIQYMANPKMFNSPKINFLTEESSEFHKYNIQRNPEHKKAMDKWISVSAKRHQFLEKVFKAKDRHLLSLSKYILQIDTKKENNNDEKKNIAEDLKTLNDLYKSGVITEEEFKKAKGKILN